MIAAALAALVAVLPFAAGETGMPYAVVPTAAERGGLADRLVADLRSAGRRAVRGASACGDAACARRAGAALGARDVVYGTVTRYMALIWGAQARMVDVRTGRVDGPYDIGYKGDYDALDRGFDALAVALDHRLATVAGRAAVGRPAPPFLVDALDGRELSLDTFRGRPLVINVFASWCASCRDELPRFVRAYARHANVAFLAIDEQEGPSVARTFAHHMGVRFAIAVDGGPMAAAYGASTIPETIVIDRHGIVRTISRGAIGEDALERALARVASPGRNA